MFVCFFRAENGPGGWAMREAEGNPNRTEYVWLFDVDLKVTATRQACFFLCLNRELRRESGSSQKGSWHILLMIKLFLLFSVLTGLATTIGHRHRHVLYVIFYWAGTKDFCPRKSWVDRKPTERRLDANTEDSIDRIRKAPAVFSGKYLWLWQERDVSIKLALLGGTWKARMPVAWQVKI